MSIAEIHIPGERLGAAYRKGLTGSAGCDFLVWAPFARSIELYLISPKERTLSMLPQKDGYFNLYVEDVPDQSLYRYRLFPHTDPGQPVKPVLRADPASRLQPRGVHGPSQVMDETFAWKDAGWNGPELADYIIYELHVGTATPAGTFEALIPLLPELRELGITAVELMPVAEFPGDRNWGYDGVYPFAAHHAYGGPAGLKRLVDACHGHGLAVVLDVVYNHLGPEGNYLDSFGPYFTETYTTPWGRAVNFDGPYSDPVRRYFLENVRYWIRDCHVDALRVDAVHGIYDFSARPFLSELTQLVAEEADSQQRRIFAIAESDLNDTKMIRPVSAGGIGFDAQWSDDFHHALHTLLTGERDGYYSDFGRLEDLAEAFRHGYVYNGRYSTHRRRRHGNDAQAEPAEKFLAYIQNHDQVGNRMAGERLSVLANFEQLKLAAACVLLSPYIPLIFMGEEYAEEAPFAYFISHGDPGLVEAVRKGRREEFRAFTWRQEPPDPQAIETFEKAKLNSTLKRTGRPNSILYSLYRELITLRKTNPALKSLHRRQIRVEAFEQARLLYILRRHGTHEIQMFFHFGEQPLRHHIALVNGNWRNILDTADSRWLGPGSQAPKAMDGVSSDAIHLLPWQVVLYECVGYAGQTLASEEV